VGTIFGRRNPARPLRSTGLSHAPEFQPDPRHIRSNRVNPGSSVVKYRLLKPLLI
jgi:hypothetical protein